MCRVEYKKIITSGVIFLELDWTVKLLFFWNNKSYKVIWPQLFLLGTPSKITAVDFKEEYLNGAFLYCFYLHKRDLNSLLWGQGAEKKLLPHFLPEFWRCARRISFFVHESGTFATKNIDSPTFARVQWAALWKFLELQKRIWKGEALNIKRIKRICLKTWPDRKRKTSAPQRWYGNVQRCGSDPTDRLMFASFNGSAVFLKIWDSICLLWNSSGERKKMGVWNRKIEFFFEKRLDRLEIWCILNLALQRVVCLKETPGWKNPENFQKAPWQKRKLC